MTNYSRGDHVKFNEETWTVLEHEPSRRSLRTNEKGTVRIIRGAWTNPTVLDGMDQPRFGRQGPGMIVGVSEVTLS